MRFGLAGTGPWARIAHGPGLVRAKDVDLVGVWGRDPDKAASLAADLGATPYVDYGDFLRDVDAVAYCLPPDVQAELALEAVRAGKHVLLDKPVATSASAAHALADAAAAAGVGSVVFFTDRFAQQSREWFEQVRRSSGWQGGWLHWFSALQAPGNPFGDSPWRRQRGALWDTGPHAISTLTAALGPVTAVTAVPGVNDVATLVLQHEGGVTSTAMLTQYAPPAAEHFEAVVFGESGLLSLPPRVDETVPDLLAAAAEELCAAVEAGVAHDLDVRFGAHVVDLLVEAERQIAAAHADPDGERAEASS
jgi:predicted dehydrogenase